MHCDSKEFKELVDVEFGDENAQDLFSKYNYYDKIIEIFKELSPGERVALIGMTSIIAYIEGNTLVILDEPELCLHPILISEYTKIIINILNEYDALCLMASNSPIVLQEFHHLNIFEYSYHNKFLLREIKSLTYGENISVILEDVLHYDIKSHSYFYQKLEEIENVEKAEDILDRGYAGSEARFLLNMLIARKEEC